MTDAYSNKDIISTDKSTVWHHLMQHKTLENGDPLVIVKGKGLRVEDADGREYLDATSAVYGVLTWVMAASASLMLFVIS